MEWEYSQAMLTVLLRYAVDDVGSLNEKLSINNPKKEVDTGGLKNEKEEKAERAARKTKNATNFAIFLFMIAFNGGKSKH